MADNRASGLRAPAESAGDARLLARHELVAMRRASILIEQLAEQFGPGLERGDLNVTVEAIRVITAGVTDDE